MKKIEPNTILVDNNNRYYIVRHFFKRGESHEGYELTADAVICNILVPNINNGWYYFYQTNFKNKQIAIATKEQANYFNKIITFK